MLKNFEELLAAARGIRGTRIVVVFPSNEETFAAIRQALDLDLARFILVGDEETQEGLFIDPADDADRLISEARSNGLSKIRYIVNTHAHVDHVMGNPARPTTAPCASSPFHFLPCHPFLRPARAAGLCRAAQPAIRADLAPAAPEASPEPAESAAR